MDFQRIIFKQYQFLIASWLLLIFVNPHRIYAQNVINPNFEKWETIGDYEDPIGWNSVNKNVAQIPGATQFPVRKTTDAYDSSYAVVMETVNFPLIQTTIPGAITTGEFLYVNNIPRFTKGMPFTGRPVSLSGYYKYIPAKGDTFGITISLLKENPQTHFKDTIATGGFRGSDFVNSYTKFSIKLDYQSSGKPDTLSLIMSSSILSQRPEGSIFYVDHLVFHYETGIEEFTPGKINQLSLFPSPFSNNLQFLKSRASAIQSLFIYNSTGKLVSKKNIGENFKGSIDLSSLPDGLYLWQGLSKGGQLMDAGKILKR